MWAYEESSDRVTWVTIRTNLTSAELEAAIHHGGLHGKGYWRAKNERTGQYL